MVEIDEASDIDEEDESSIEEADREEPNEDKRKKQSAPAPKKKSKCVKPMDPNEYCWAECGVQAQWGSAMFLGIP